jgi:carbonic anhydrase/acetyltransferase-like protein (isoleucine patch superfamily)
VPVYQLEDRIPEIDPSAYVDANAVLIGRVILKPNSSVWPFVTLRGDNESITIGVGSNVQDGSVIHTDEGGTPVIVGDNVTIGHQVMLHGCSIGAGSLIGIQAVILNGAKIGRNCLVGAGALVTENKEFPDNSLIVGAPARVIRTLSDADIARMQQGTAHYVHNAERYKTGLKRIDA